MNPPGAWAVAVRDAPAVAEQLWTFHSPKGPKGRFDPCSFGFWGIWNFSANAAAAKSLLMYLSTRTSVEKLVAGSHGVDIPPFEKLRDFTLRETISGKSNYMPKLGLSYKKLIAFHLIGALRYLRASLNPFPRTVWDVALASGEATALKILRNHDDRIDGIVYENSFHNRP